MSELVMLLTELDRCKSQYAALAERIEALLHSESIDAVTLAEVSRLFRETSARMEAVTREILKPRASGVQ